MSISAHSSPRRNMSETDTHLKPWERLTAYVAFIAALIFTPATLDFSDDTATIRSQLLMILTVLLAFSALAALRDARMEAAELRHRRTDSIYGNSWDPDPRDPLL